MRGAGFGSILWKRWISFNVFRIFRVWAFTKLCQTRADPYYLLSLKLKFNSSKVKTNLLLSVFTSTIQCTSVQDAQVPWNREQSVICSMHLHFLFVLSTWFRPFKKYSSHGTLVPIPMSIPILTSSVHVPKQKHMVGPRAGTSTGQASHSNISQRNTQYNNNTFSQCLYYWYVHGHINSIFLRFDSMQDISDDSQNEFSKLFTFFRMVHKNNF
jgi:hypothetical protein